MLISRALDEQFADASTTHSNNRPGTACCHHIQQVDICDTRPQHSVLIGKCIVAILSLEKLNPGGTIGKDADLDKERNICDPTDRSVIFGHGIGFDQNNTETPLNAVLPVASDHSSSRARQKLE